MWRRSKSQALATLLDGVVLAPLLTSITYFARWSDVGLDMGKGAAMERFDFGHVEAASRALLEGIFEELGVGSMDPDGVVRLSSKGWDAPRRGGQRRPPQFTSRATHVCAHVARAATRGRHPRTIHITRRRSPQALRHAGKPNIPNDSSLAENWAAFPLPLGVNLVIFPTRNTMPISLRFLTILVWRRSGSISPARGGDLPKPSLFAPSRSSPPPSRHRPNPSPSPPPCMEPFNLPPLRPPYRPSTCK